RGKRSLTNAGTTTLPMAIPASATPLASRKSVEDDPSTLTTWPATTATSAHASTCQAPYRWAHRAATAPKAEKHTTGKVVSTPAVVGDRRKSVLTSSRTAPTLTAADRRLKARRTTAVRTSQPRCARHARGRGAGRDEGIKGR